MTRHRRTLFAVFFVMIPLVVLGLSQNRVTKPTTKPTTNATEGSSTRVPIDYSAYFTEEGPGGNWVVAAAIDRNQRENNQAPVVIDGIRSLLGQGRFVDLIVRRVILANRTS